MADEQLRIILTGDGSDLEKSLKKASGQLQAFGSKVKNIGSSLTRLSLPLAVAGGAAIKMASDFQESINKVDVAFKGSSKNVKDFAKTTLDSFGIAEGTALDMAALFGDMSTSMGLNTKEAANMSTALVGLAGDLSSFKNMNIEQVTTALNGVFTGETESLKRLGIVMTEANLKQFALSKGITKNIKDFSQAEKVQLRYQFVMAMTTNAHGDFERTQGGAANQMRIFQETMKELGATFGETILPMFTEAVKKVNALLKEFKELSPEAKKSIMVFGGIVAALGPALVIIGNVSIALGKMKTAITALGTASSGAVGIAIGAIGGLLLAFDQLTDKIANNLSLWEKLKITFESGGLFSPTGMAQAVVQMGTTSFIKGEQQKQDESLSGMDLLSFGQDKTKTEDVTPFVKAVKEVKTFGVVLSDVMPQAESSFQGLTEHMRMMSEQVNVLSEGTSALALAVGQTLMASFQNLMNGGNFFQSIGRAITSLIKKLIAAAAAAAVLNLLLGGSLAASGSSFSFKNIFGNLSGLGNFAAFANGGIVSTPTLGLVGEYAGARSNPEVIAPLDKLKSMLGDRPGGDVRVSGEFGIKGQDLVVVLDRANRERNRIT